MNAGAFIFVLCPKTQRILLGKRNKETDWHPSKWFSFGGTMEEGETPRQTAVREFFEETKITPEHYKLSESYVYMAQDVDGEGNLHDIYLFIATMSSEVFPEIDYESQDWKWFKLTDIPNIDAHPLLFELFSDKYSITEIKKALMRNYFSN